MIETRDLLREAGRAGIALQPPAAQRLADFGALLLRWNRSFNLISHRDEPRLLNRHLLDSLTALPWLKGHALADLGSGAGLPGIPLAIACPERNFVLIDRHEKRMRFVQQAVIELDLKNVTPVLDDLARFRAETLFDTVVSRAVSDAERLWGLARPLLTSDGRAVLYCGADANPPGHLDGVARTNIVDVELPDLERRHRLLVIDRD